MNPKLCNCGKQGFIINSRQQSDHVMRRYECECGERWSSFEMKLGEGVHCKNLNDTLARQYSTADRDAIADKLIELAQELLR